MKAAIAAIMVLAILPLAGAVDGATGVYDIEMEVEDSFSYTPQVNLTGTVITCTGTAMESEGGFLGFAGGTLFGVADRAGSFQVVIQAHWESEGLVQDAYQTINFIILEQASPSYSNYVAFGPVGSMALSEEQVPVYGPTEIEDHSKLDKVLLYVAIALGIAAVIIAIMGIVVYRRD